MTRMVPAVVAVALLAAPAVLTAQSLGEAAAKEKERREKSTKPAKSYTENDLRSGGTVTNSTGSPSSDPSPAASPAAEGAAPAVSDAQRAANQEAWQKNRDRLNREIARITAAVDSFQARLNDNTQPMYGPGRQATVDNLERAKADLVRAQADLEKHEAEGRTNGYQ